MTSLLAPHRIDDATRREFLAALAAAGPLAVCGTAEVGPATSTAVEDAESLGVKYDPEQLADLGPDVVIVNTDFDVERLERIAPTVARAADMVARGDVIVLDLQAAVGNHGYAELDAVLTQLAGGL